MLSTLLKGIHEPVYEHRLDVLADLITARLRPGDRVLDIGCGGGMLGHRILHGGACPSGVTVTGVEKFPRGGEPIEVVGYEGGRLPFDDRAFDVTILADVLHHERDEPALLREAARVAGRAVFIKDHRPCGLLGRQRICFLDWAANNPYGVECLYRYHRVEEWRELFEEGGLEVHEELTSIDLYPPVFNGLFGRGLQYFAVVSAPR